MDAGRAVPGAGLLDTGAGMSLRARVGYAIVNVVINLVASVFVASYLIAAAVVGFARPARR
jgi:hypothetical protein